MERDASSVSEEALREIFDRITREVTENSVGIQLVQNDFSPGDDLYTVHVNFERGFHSSLSLRADRTMLTRLAQSMLQTEEVTAQDLEDVTKEYFNVLCGRIARALYEATHIAARFDVPSFHRGTFSPAQQEEQFVISYSSGRNGSAQLVHHVPSQLQDKLDEELNITERGDME